MNKLLLGLSIIFMLSGCWAGVDKAPELPKPNSQYEVQIEEPPVLIDYQDVEKDNPKFSEYWFEDTDDQSWYRGFIKSQTFETMFGIGVMKGFVCELFLSNQTKQNHTSCEFANKPEANKLGELKVKAPKFRMFFDTQNFQWDRVYFKDEVSGRLSFVGVVNASLSELLVLLYKEKKFQELSDEQKKQVTDTGGSQNYWNDVFVFKRFIPDYSDSLILTPDYGIISESN